MKNIFRLLTLIIVVSSSMVLTAQRHVVTIHEPEGPAATTPSMLYGIFYEDINHAADGGIYAELVRNRSFEDSSAEPQGWKPFVPLSGNVRMTLVHTDLLNSAQKTALHIQTIGIGDCDAGIANQGFWGINAVKGRKYDFSCWGKFTSARKLYAMLTDKTGQHIYGQVELHPKRSGKWEKVKGSFVCRENDRDAQFVLTACGNADFTVDMVSLFPPTYKNRENGLRPDLVEMLQDLKPRFMRFPGGCFVEGQDTPDNAFRWERTIGPVEQRPGHWNKNWGYRTSDGLGFHEYLQLAEDLGAKPLYVTNIGIWHGGVTPLNELDSWIDECLNALEYANGSVKTKYGKMRADNGHPEPFNIEYIEIGNENNQKDGEQTSDKYYERYKRFRQAILKRYPKMHIIGDVPAWGTDDPRWESKEKVDLVDEHYYRSPGWFAMNFHKYDTYDRRWPKVYCGEYAVTQGFGTLGNLNAALGEAVFMMGMENNMDMVEMSSYAPIFVNENDDRWRPDMVRFSNARVMGTPSYYVQRMMAENVGTRAMKVDGNTLINEDTDIHTPLLSFIGIGTWKTQAEFRLMRITDQDGVHEIPLDNRWTQQSLGWEVADGKLRQTGNDEQQLALCPYQAKGRRYSVFVEARKSSGDEGFIIPFNYVDRNNMCWLNVGGWGNNNHGIEQTMDGGQTCIVSVPGKIKPNHWYGIRIEVDNNNITAFLDEEEILHTTLRSNTTSGIFTSASIDDMTGERIIKIVNTGAEQTTMQLNVDDKSAQQSRKARRIQLTSLHGTDENTLDLPTQVYPVEKPITFRSGDEILVPGYSLTIIRY